MQDIYSICNKVMKQASNEIKISGSKGNTIGSIKTDIPRSHFIESGSKSSSRVH